MYQSQYLTNGGELSYNMNGMNGTKDYQMTDHISNLRSVITLNLTDSTKTMTSNDYKLFWHLFYVVRDGIEPPTHGFSVHCSTN
jgi:hypothetical protein